MKGNIIGNIIIIALVFGAITLFFGNIYIGLVGLIAFLYPLYKEKKERKKKNIDDVIIRL